MSGCGGNNTPPGYTANLLPLMPTWNYWSLGALPEKIIKFKIGCPPRDAKKCHAHMSLRVTQSETEHSTASSEEAGWLI